MTERDAFQAAADHVEKSIRIGEEAFAGDEIKLKLYGLYKQALLGPVQESQPSLFHPKQRAKWNAWKNVCGLSQEEAQKRYIELVAETSPDWEETSTKNTEGHGTGPVFSRLVLDASDDVNASTQESSDSKKVLDILVESEMDHDRWREALKAEGKEADVMDDCLRNVLHWASDTGNLDAVRFLLQMQIVDVNSQDSEQMTPLHYAALCEHQDVCSESSLSAETSMRCVDCTIAGDARCTMGSTRWIWRDTLRYGSITLATLA